MDERMVLIRVQRDATNMSKEILKRDLYKSKETYRSKETNDKPELSGGNDIPSDFGEV